MLYQTGTQRIEIIVRKDMGGQQPTQSIDESANGSGATVDATGTVLRQTKSRRFMITNVTHALSVAHGVFDLATNYAITGIANKYGDQAFQDKVQRDVEVFQDVSNVATGTVMGALYGSAGGVAGAIFGAVFGLARTTASVAVKYAGRQREYDYNIFKENNSIEYQRARASINWTTGRLR